MTQTRKPSAPSPRQDTRGETPDLLAEAGLRPGRGIDDWLDWVLKRSEANQ